MPVINVVLGGETFYEAGVPCVRGGTLTKADSEQFEKREHHIDNDVEETHVVEYWAGDQLVHRSVDMHLKTGIFADAIQGDFG